ncbi:MAG TPA: hypothetical protein VH309_10600, partial [Elusimicrobiota bacterium]|nr:hypothetical protein [Elusimicrobiota bacterium]
MIRSRLGLSLVLTFSAAAAAAAQQAAGLKQSPRDAKTGIILASTSPIVVEAPFGVTAKMESFDESRDEVLLPKIGVTAYSMSSATISALPQGEDTPIDKVILQAPGVVYDGFTGHGFHVRNEYANTQTRINGILLPEGVTSLGPMLGTSFIGNLNILEGTL